MSLETLALDPEDQKALGMAAHHLYCILKASDRFIMQSADPPVPGSPMEQSRRDKARDPYDYAYALIFSAEDHLRTMLTVIKHGPLPGYSLYTLARAAAESLVRAAYLLEVPSTPAERLGRTLNERLDNLDEQRKVGRDLEEHYRQSVSGLETKAGEHGVTVLLNSAKSGAPRKVIGFGTQKKSVTDLFEQFLTGGEAVYRYLSGYAHSKMWAQLPRSRAERSPDDPDIALVGTDLNVRLFTGVLKSVTVLYDQVLANWILLGGYPSEVWRMAKQGVQDKFLEDI